MNIHSLKLVGRFRVSVFKSFRFRQYVNKARPGGGWWPVWPESGFYHKRCDFWKFGVIRFWRVWFFYYVNKKKIKLWKFFKVKIEIFCYICLRKCNKNVQGVSFLAIFGGGTRKSQKVWFLAAPVCFLT